MTLKEEITGLLNSLNDYQPRVLTWREARLVAKTPNIERMVRTDFGFSPISRGDLLHLIDLGREDVLVQKEHHFSIYYFSKP